MITSRRVLIASVAGLAVSLTVVGAQAYMASAADGAPGVSAVDAAARVSQIVPGGGDAQVALIKDPDGKHRHYRVVSDAAVANVDASNGRVSTLVILASVPAGKTVAFDASGVTIRSKAYLDRSGILTAGLTPDARLVDHGSYQEWVVQWQRRVNGALAPETVQVSVNPETGDVFSLVNISTPFTMPPTPAISQEKATAIAQSHVGWKPTSVVSSDLVIGFAPNGSQILAWQFVITTKQAGVPLYARLDVDAIDGSVTDLGRG